MKNISKEDFLEALSKSLNKTQLMRNLGYKGGYRISQIKDWEREFNININIDNIIRQNIEQYNKEHITHYRCKQCGKEFTEKYSKTSSGEFCSRTCAAKYSALIKREETNKKQHDIMFSIKYVNGEIIEIKNYYREINDIKLNAVNKPIKILYYDDLIPIFDYVAKTYDKKYNRHKNNFYELYEENH